jgi:hypothetical protein
MNTLGYNVYDKSKSISSKIIKEGDIKIIQRMEQILQGHSIGAVLQNYNIYTKEN